MPEATRVRAMFGRIAPRYDLLNRLLSAGIDRRWRRRVLERAGDVRGRRVLDVACGTGDLALAFAASGARVLGVDFTWPMLQRAKRKDAPGERRFVCADALHLPVADDSVRAASIAFGLRNVADRGRALGEMARVVEPGGHVLVLEFSLPPNRLLRTAYQAYFTRVLPTVGGWISGDASAYRYLPDTVLVWPRPERLREEMEAAGLVDCGFRLLSGGIACLSHGRVPGGGT